MRRNPGEEDPVARLQEEARWSSFTNSWSRQVSGGAPRWVRWFIMVVVVLILFVPGLIGLIELVTRDGSSGRPFPSDCPTVPPTGGDGRSLFGVPLLHGTLTKARSALAHVGRGQARKTRRF